METIEQRLTRLERSVTRWRAGCTIAITILVCFSILGAKKATDPFAEPAPDRKITSFDLVRCRGVLIENAKGEPLGMLGEDESAEGAMLLLFKNKKVDDWAISLRVSEKGSGIQLGNPMGGKFVMSLWSSDTSAMMECKTLDKSVVKIGSMSSGGVANFHDMGQRSLLVDADGVANLPTRPK